MHAPSCEATYFILEGGNEEDNVLDPPFSIYFCLHVMNQRTFVSWRPCYISTCGSSGVELLNIFQKLSDPRLIAN